jgi:L-cysteine:1D-myo-inositol 2-amino-2-deoxy-alpha-D-glucopyranoside ligase
MKSWAELSLGDSEGYRDAYKRLSLYNTASQKVEELPGKDHYRLYVCGITPYDATHLGHAATYVSFDLINRFLRFGGAQVSFVQNITDIDDPLFERAKRDGVDWSELATSQIELFRGDMVALHVLPPDHYVGVVEAMQIIVDAI